MNKKAKSILPEETDPLATKQNEAMFVGAVYKHPDLLAEYDPYIRSKYDFSDDYQRFLYDNAQIMYKRSLPFDRNGILSYYSKRQINLPFTIIDLNCLAHPFANAHSARIGK